MEELLYFSCKVVHFSYIEGNLNIFDKNNIYCDKDSEEISKSRKLPVDTYNDKGVVVPAMPIYDIKYEEKNKNDKNIDNIDIVLRKPLIKSENGNIKGYASGIRSALLLGNDNIWYRLKGCGNNNDGFPIHNVIGNDNLVTIRGCTFQHTVLREMWMTNNINEILKANNLKCGNEAIGWYIYDSSKEPLPKILRCCGIFKTYGDRRLGDHVLLGLEKLLEYFIFHENHYDIWIKKMFEANRVQDDKIATATWLQALTGAPFENFNNLSLSFKFANINKLNLNQEIIPNWITKAWQDCYDYINNVSSDKLEKTLANLYYRFGYECGVILKHLHQNNILWGTYTDDMGTHNNAHSNNLILINNVNNQLLAPVDFDMAFPADEYINSKEDDFENSKILELNGMRLTLGGDIEASSGVTAGSAKLSPENEIIKWCLRDTMLYAFDLAYKNNDLKLDNLPNVTHEMRILCKMALILTNNIIA